MVAFVVGPPFFGLAKHAGGLGNVILNSYSAAVLVAGGSGITFPLAAIEEIVVAIRNGTSSIKYIELIWCTRDAGGYYHFFLFLISFSLELRIK